MIDPERSSARRCASVYSRSRLLAIAFALLFGLSASGLAAAQTFPLTLELQTGQVDEFGVVRVEPDDQGALVFEVELDPTRVGADASVRRLFFNLLPETTGVWIEPLGEDDASRFVVRAARRKIGRSGVRLDWRIDFHPPRERSRAGRSGEQDEDPGPVRFRMFADTALAIEDLLPVSLTRDGDPVQVVVDTKRGRGPDGDRVLWVGGTYQPPEEPPEEPPILR